MPTPHRLHRLHFLATAAALLALALPPRAAAAPAQTLSDRTWTEVAFDFDGASFRCLPSVLHPQYPVDGELELTFPDLWRYVSLSHYPAVGRLGADIGCASGLPTGKVNGTVRVVLQKAGAELSETVTVKVGGLELKSLRQLPLTPAP